MSSYRVGVGRAWCSWKACKNMYVTGPKEEIEKKPKQQSTSFWSQGILGVNILQLASPKEVCLGRVNWDLIKKQDAYLRSNQPSNKG